MAIIYTYPTKGTPAADDLLIISDKADKNKTKQIDIQAIIDLIGSKVVSSISTNNGQYIELTPVGPETGAVTITAALKNEAKELLTSFSVNKVVCAPVTNVAGPPNAGDGIPNNSTGVNWYFSNNTIQKWEVTGTNAPIKRQHIGFGKSVNLQVIVSGGASVGNDVEWSLRLYTLDRSNYYQLAASTGEPGDNNIGQPLTSQGPTASLNNFTNCWRETKITNLDLGTNFFDDFAVQEGEIELWARNPNSQSYIISYCSVDFYS